MRFPDGAINYIETVFEYKELTKIHGEPTYESVKRLHNEVKANAVQVRSNLGGGNFGHLGLVMSNAQYALISGVPFNRPAHSGPLVVPPGSTQAQIQAIRDTHREQLRVFHEVLGVESNLRQQIVAAIEPPYLKTIRNRHTNAINLTISEIFMLHLYPRYGMVDPQILADEYTKVSQMNYDVAFPPDEVYEAVEDLLDMTETAEVPYTQKQATCIMNADSGASRHYIRKEDATVLDNRIPDNNGPIVTLPDSLTL